MTLLAALFIVLANGASAQGLTKQERADLRLKIEAAGFPCAAIETAYRPRSTQNLVAKCRGGAQYDVRHTGAVSVREPFDPSGIASKLAPPR